MTIAHGFTYEIIHGEDFDPRCDVCTYHTEILHKILGEWLEDAIFLEPGDDRTGIDPKRMVLLKPFTNNLPLPQRIGIWFVGNFDDTIKLAAVNKILFRDTNTETEHEFIITY